jgi:hypothetical protein
MIRLSMIAGVCATLVAGCSSFQPSADTVDLNGPIPGNVTVELFKAAYTSAYDAQLLEYKGAAPGGGDQAKYRLMAKAGFGVVAANCAQFFKSRGLSQSWLHVGSDIVATAGTATTGILAVSGAGALALSITALTTATLYSGINVYEKNFLFGADNIESVTTMTMKALGDNASTVLAASGDWDFLGALKVIMANQEMCKPQAILALARETLKGGTPKTISDDGVAQLDGTFTAAIGQAAGLSSDAAPNDTQVAALCWAADPGKVKPGDDVIYKPLLAGFPAGPDTLKWYPSRISSLCQKLSSGRQALINDTIAKLRSQAAAGAPVPASPPLPATSVAPAAPAAGSISTKTFTTFGGK